MSNFMDGLYLLFVARQGYWDSSDKVNFKTFWKYIYPYFSISVVLLAIFPIFQNDLMMFLKKQHFLGIFSYELIFWIVFYVIIPLGLAYENFYVMKSNTPLTFKLFFNVTGTKFQYLLLVKNLILTLPVITISLFYQPIFTILLLITVHFISQKLSAFLLDFSFSTPKLSDYLNYLLSIVEWIAIVKYLAVTVISMTIFFLLFKYQPSFLNLEFRTFDEVLFASVFLGSVFYSHKGLAYIFMSLINDIPYLKAIGINVKRFLNKKLFFILTTSYAVTIFPFIIGLIILKFTWFQMAVLSFGIYISYLSVQGFQMRESLFFKDKYIKNIKELESYRFPLKHHLYIWASRLFFVVIFLVDRYLTNSFSRIASIAIIFLLIYSFLLNYRKTLNQFTNCVD
ncbi:MAG: hypothetical protein Q4A90_04185 [Streptococcus sp.]|nr:hypothetical protein [Streptococcus sp.]